MERLRSMPRTYVGVPGAEVTPVFDPALKHYQDAFRAADPRFSDEEAGRRWREARAAALEQVVRAVARSRWAGGLVLRGSMLLRAWYGEAARDPGDLDFVVVPEHRGIGDAETGRMFAGIARAAEEGPVPIDASGARTDDIWTYDRVPGRRLVLPWDAGGGMSGAVQLDFTFGERLPLPPEPTRVAGVEIPAATPELSLAWKLQWLLTDAYPQGKDLYDAVVLSERTTVSHRLLKELAVSVLPGYASTPLSSAAFDLANADWEDPDLPPSRDALIARLTTAIDVICAEPLDEPDDDEGRRVLWFGPRIDACRTAARTGGAKAVGDLLVREDSMAFEDQALIASEALGVPLREAARILLADWKHLNGYYVRQEAHLMSRLDVLTRPPGRTS